MSINWPNALIVEIARRRCLIFIGSGVTASAIVTNDANRPKTWEVFLRDACSLLKDTTINNEADSLIESKNYLLALQVIKDHSNTSDYNSYLTHCFNNPNHKPSKLHEVIRDIDSRIVVTTNFDKLYERFCESSSSSYAYSIVNHYDNNLGDLIRSEQRVIIKAHGTINNLNNMIFTKSQYNEAKRKYIGFYEILKSLFITHTCIFIGCGGDDPDISLVLQDVHIASSSSHPHYFLTKINNFSPAKKRDLKDTYNIEALEYSPDHTALIDDLVALQEQVESYRATYPES